MNSVYIPGYGHGLSSIFTDDEYNGNTFVTQPLIIRFIGTVGLGELMSFGEGWHFGNAHLPLGLVRTGHGSSLTTMSDINQRSVPNTGGSLLNVRNMSNITFEGVGDDAVINGWGFHIIGSNNIVVRNLTFQWYPDDAILVQGADGSAIAYSIYNGNLVEDEPDRNSFSYTSHNIWIHHNRFYRGSKRIGAESDQVRGDGAIDSGSGVTFMTVAFNHFVYTDKTALHNGANTNTFARLTWHHNWFQNSNSRTPWTRVALVHLFNNFYDNSGTARATDSSNHIVEGNFLLNSSGFTGSFIHSSTPNELIPAWNGHPEIKLSQEYFTKPLVPNVRRDVEDTQDVALPVGSWGTSEREVLTRVGSAEVSVSGINKDPHKFYDVHVTCALQARMNVEAYSGPMRGAHTNRHGKMPRNQNAFNHVPDVNGLFSKDKTDTSFATHLIWSENFEGFEPGFVTRDELDKLNVSLIRPDGLSGDYANIPDPAFIFLPAFANGEGKNSAQYWPGYPVVLARPGSLFRRESHEMGPVGLELGSRHGFPMSDTEYRLHVVQASILTADMLPTGSSGQGNSGPWETTPSLNTTRLNQVLYLQDQQFGGIGGAIQLKRDIGHHATGILVYEFDFAYFVRMSDGTMGSANFTPILLWDSNEDIVIRHVSTSLGFGTPDTFSQWRKVKLIIDLDEGHYFIYVSKAGEPDGDLTRVYAADFNNANGIQYVGGRTPLQPHAGIANILAEISLLYDNFSVRSSSLPRCQE